MSSGLTLGKIKTLDNQLLSSPSGKLKHFTCNKILALTGQASGAYNLLLRLSTVLIAAEKLALPRSTTWRFSLGPIAFFRCLYDHQRQESHNQPRPYKYPVLIRNLFAALYTIAAVYRGFFIKSYALTRLIFHRSSTSTMRSSFELKDERAPCKKTRLRMIFCFFDAPPSTPFSPSKVPSQYVGQGWIRTNDYVNRFSFLSILRDATVISCSLTTHRKHDKCISRNRHH